MKLIDLLEEIVPEPVKKIVQTPEHKDAPFERTIEKDTKTPKKIIIVTEGQFNRLVNENEDEIEEPSSDYLTHRKELAKKMNELLEKNNVNEITINSEIPAAEWVSFVDNENVDLFNSYIEELETSEDGVVNFKKLVHDGDTILIDGKSYVVGLSNIDNYRFVEEYKSQLQPEVIKFYNTYFAPQKTEDNLQDDLYGDEEKDERRMKYDNMDGNRKFGSDYNYNSGRGYEDDRNLSEDIKKIKDNFKRIL